MWYLNTPDLRFDKGMSLRGLVRVRAGHSGLPIAFATKALALEFISLASLAPSPEAISAAEAESRGLFQLDEANVLLLSDAQSVKELLNNRDAFDYEKFVVPRD